MISEEDDGGQSDAFGRLGRAPRGALGDALLLADDGGRYVDCNEEAQMLLGYTRAELLELSVWDLTPQNDQELGKQQWASFIKGGTLTGVYRLRQKNGEEVEVAFRAVTNVRPGIHASWLTRLATPAGSIPIGALVLDRSGNVLGANPTALKVLGDTSESLSAVFGSSIREGSGAESRLAADSFPTTYFQVPRRFEVILPSGSLPATRFEVESLPFNDPRTGDDLALLSFIDTTDAVRLGEDLKQRLELLDGYTEMSKLLGKSGSLEPSGLQPLVDVLARVAGDYSSIALLEGDSVRVVAAALRDRQGELVPAAPRGFQIGIGTGFYGTVVSSGQPLTINIAEVAPESESMLLEWHQLLRSADVQSIAGYPIRVGSRVLGVLTYATRGASTKFDGSNWMWLQDMADRIGIGLENARLGHESSARVARLRALQTIQHMAAENFAGSAPLESILTHVIAEHPLSAAIIARLDEDRQVLVPAASVGHMTSVAHGSEVPVGHGVIGRAALLRRTLHIPTSSDLIDRQRSNFFESEGVVEVHATPLLTGGELRGVLGIYARSPIPPDPERDAFIETVAAHAAIALGRDAVPEASLRLRVRGGRELSPTELVITRLVCRGRSNEQIAAEVHLSTSTVRFHLRKLYRQLKVANRVEFAALAMRRGWA